MGLYFGNIDKDKLPVGVTNEILSQHKIYGVSFNGASHKGVRLYDAEGMRWSPSNQSAAGTDDFKDLAPFKISKVKATNGTDNMVEFTLGYYKRPNAWTFLISPDYVEGFKPLPMFVRNGKIHDKFRISEYPVGSDFSSKSGQKPKVNTTMDQFRSGLRGRGLRVLDVAGYESVTMLAIVKYADLNSQFCNGFGIASGGSVTTLGDTIKGDDGYQSSISAIGHIRCMGIEDFYGHVWKFTEGVFEYDGRIYINDDIDNITAWPSMDNYTQLGWKDTGFSSCGSNGYIKTLSNNASYQWILYPATVGGNETDPVGDWFSTNHSGQQCFLLGGGYGSGSGAGFLRGSSNNDGLSVSDSDCGALSCETI